MARDGPSCSDSRRPKPSIACGFAFFELLVFLLILILGLAYVWRHGDLEWIRQARQDTLDKLEPEEESRKNKAA